MIFAAAILVLGLAPGIYARWSSTKLLSRLEDPLFPELALAHTRRVGTAVGIAVGLGLVVARQYLLLLLALVFVSVLTGGFFARRRIFGEVWSLFAYLGHATRFWLAAIGYVLLIAAIPSILIAVGEILALPVGIALSVAAVVWAIGSSQVFRLLMRARPLKAPEVEAALAPILERARCEAPLLLEADAPGGSWVNGFALPSVGRGAVLFTRGLLDGLSVRETAAIFAHEIAHLEHFTRRTVALGIALTGVLALMAVGLWAGPFAPSFHGWEWIWPIAVLVGLVLRAAKHRAHEGESDLRALELCQDPEALVSGLTKLHALLRIPRRWDGDFEKTSSHPSLARRIHAIRRAAAASGATAPGEPFEELFHSAGDGSSAVLFDAERLHWLRGVPEDGKDLLARAAERRSLSYSDLRDLRLEHRTEGYVLTFTDSSGQTTRMPVAKENVASLQSLLDRLDSSVGYAAPVERVPTGRFWSFLLLVVAAVTTSFAAAVLALSALVRPGVATLIAAGAGALGTAVVLALQSQYGSFLLFLLGGVALFFGWKRHRLETESGRADILLGTLLPLLVLLSSLLGAVRALASALPMTLIHSWAASFPGFLAGALGLAAVLVLRRNVLAYAGASILLVAGGAFLFLGSSSFRERFSEDVFARPLDPIPTRDLALEELRSVVIPGGVFRLALSPSGARIAAAVTAPGGEPSYGTYTTEVFYESAPGELSSFRATAFDFLDEDRLLVLGMEPGRAVLELRDLGAGTKSTIATDLPILAAPRIQTYGDGWWVVGSDWETEENVLVRGSIGSPEREEMRLGYPDWSGLLAVNRSGWALEPEYEMPDFGGWDESVVPYAPWLLYTLGSSFVTELRLTPPGEPPVGVGKSTLTVSCVAGASESRFFCAASEIESTSLWTFEPETRQRWEPLGKLSGYFHFDDPNGDGPLVMNSGGGVPLLVNVETRTADRLVIPRGEETIGILAVRGDVVARAVSAEEATSTSVALYRIRR